MIFDLYARLERRHWLDLARLPIVLMLAFACFVIGATAGHAASMRFTETTGRAVIIDPAMEQEARMTALEDALYLAALEGGARIDGFSAVSFRLDKRNISIKYKKCSFIVFYFSTKYLYSMTSAELRILNDKTDFFIV